jgi:cysteine desulfurase
VAAEALGVRPDEVSFTPSGTDAVHRGLLGLVRGSRRGDVVVEPPPGIRRIRTLERG